MPKVFREGIRKSNRLAKRREQEEYDPADVYTLPSSPVADDNQAYWVERSYNFKTKEESARIMPNGFEPPVDDENGRYLTGEEYAQELLDDIMKDNVEKDDKLLRDAADVVLKGVKWEYLSDEEMLFNSENEHTIHGIFASEWVALRRNGYTYLKKVKRDNPPFYTIYENEEN
jgi:hypothetical protein